MSVMSRPSRKKSWQTGRQRVSVLAALAIEKETVSQRLMQLREAHGEPGTGRPLAQEKAAARVGVTMRQWQRWESGTSVPYPRNLEAIADAFDFDVAEFFNDPPTASTPSPFESLADAPEWARRLAVSVGTIEALLERQSDILSRIEELVLALPTDEATEELMRATRGEDPPDEQATRGSEGTGRATRARREAAG